MNHQLHHHTPTLQVLDPFGQPVRALVYYRHPDRPNDTVTRITANQALKAGRISSSWDPRLLAMKEAGDAVEPNVITHHSLSGRPLFVNSVDAGWRLSFSNALGQSQLSWDGRGTRTRQSYDELQRPVEVFEQDAASPERCLGRTTYAAQSLETMALNQCGQPIVVVDSAGSLHREHYSLQGAPLIEIRYFLEGLEEPDWSGAPRHEEAEGDATHWTYSALGETLSQTDAKGNTQSSHYDVSGQLRETRLQPAGQDEQTLVSGIVYNALGQITSEAAGNGVITQSHYRPDTGQLIRLMTQGPDCQPLQDLFYGYDPVGNILSVEDQAQTIHYFANQIIRPFSTYCYDTQYQLIKATGREARNIQHGPDSRGIVSDPQQLANYTQTYDYDAAGNLQTLKHVGAQCYTRQMSTARGSNRSLIELTDQPQTEKDIAQGFDASGNLQRLQPGGLTLGWDRRNQLRHVSPVVREEGLDDSEWYVYDGGGQRVRKVSRSQARRGEWTAEVRYLPGLEIRTNSATGETLHVISAPGGLSSVRMLHWEAGQPSGIDNDQLRYSLSDHLGSGTLELDEQARLLSQEGYYPYGGTAWWAARNQTEAKYKTIRYSGKERDATGLYYYGFRYYAPWLGRWINPDPAGTIDGLNVYAFLSGRVINTIDINGLKGDPCKGGATASAEELKKLNAKKNWNYLRSRVKKQVFNSIGKDYLGEFITTNAFGVGPLTVKYFSAQERLQYATSSVDGVLEQGGSEINPKDRLTTSSKNWLNESDRFVYVLGFDKSREKKLLVYKYEIGKVHHSSGFSGGAVLDAGLMTVVNGNVAYLENKSGHYKPNIESKLYTLKYLEDFGFDLRHIFVSEHLDMGGALGARFSLDDDESIDLAFSNRHPLYRADVALKKREFNPSDKSMRVTSSDGEFDLAKKTRVRWPEREITKM